MRSSEFMQALPAAVQSRLPAELPLRQGRVWSFGVQWCDDDRRFHYEVARTPKRLGDRLELGLHFESRNARENRTMLDGFAARLLEIKGELGDGMEAEPWDRGWTKVYETIPLAPYDDTYLALVADRLVEIIKVLHPIYRTMR